MRSAWFIPLLILSLTQAACGAFSSPLPSPTPTEITQPAGTVPVLATLSPTPDTLPTAASQSGTIYWPMQAFAETGDPDWAAGKPDVSDCSAPMLTTWAPSMGDQSAILTLSYPTPIIASQVDIFYIGQPGEILRVEVQNSLSGLGQLIHDGEESVTSQSAPRGSPGQSQCPAKLSLPVSAEFDVDIVILTVAASGLAVQIDAVGLTGEMLGYIEPPVYWRVPLSGTPVSIAANQTGLIFAAIEPAGLFSYDVEGNQLKQLAVPSQAQLTDVTADPLGNFIVLDDGFGWFIRMSPEGEHLTIGGDYLYGQAAINPVDGNLYILQDKSLRVYTTDTAELLREISLDEMPAYAGLAFDSQGRLFTLRNPQWQPELLQIDPQNGSELDAIPLARADQSLIEIVARDLAIDANGNVYILFGMNTGQIAVHLFDARGNFIRRFGRLTSDVDDWPEGAFLDPRAISVSPDGRFVLVADGYGATSYLTAFLLEPGQ